MKKEPFYPYEFPKHMCDHCEDKYDWETGVFVTTRAGEIFSGHEKCMHVVYAKLKESGKL